MTVDPYVAKLEKQIRELIDTRDDKVRLKVYDYQDRLATEFGRIHGWIRAPRLFGMSQLARRSNRQTRQELMSGLDGTPYCDHRYCYRDPLAGYRPSALAVHLYNFGKYEEDLIAARCESLGLVYKHITEFPSWWYPGSTSLILYTPKPEAQ